MLPGIKRLIILVATTNRAAPPPMSALTAGPVPGAPPDPKRVGTDFNDLVTEQVA